MRLGMSHGFSADPGPEELNQLGLIVSRTIAFAQSRFAPTFVYDDPVNLETVSAGGAFARDPNGHIWLLAQERLPYDATVFAVGIDRDRLFVETAPIDTEAVASMIGDERPNLDLKRRAHGRHRGAYELRTPRSHKPLAVLMPGASEEIPAELGPRWLTTIHWTHCSAEDVEHAAWLMDQIFQRNLHVRETDDVAAPTAARPAMRQEQILDIQMQQRPHLMLELGISGQMRMELQAMLVLQQTMLRLPDAELPAFLARSFKERGVEDTFRAIRFVLAGKIKRAQPDLTWPQARAQARGMERRIRGG